MSTPPGGQRILQKRNKAQSAKDNKLQKQPGQKKDDSSILKIYSDESTGLRVDPLVVLFLAVGFIFSVVALHVIAKITSKVF